MCWWATTGWGELVLPASSRWSLDVFNLHAVPLRSGLGATGEVCMPVLPGIFSLLPQIGQLLRYRCILLLQAAYLFFELAIFFVQNFGIYHFSFNVQHLVEVLHWVLLLEFLILDVHLGERFREDFHGLLYIFAT